jgi:hypothetical protein
LAPQFVERASKLRAKQAEVPLDALGAADHHMVRPSEALYRNDLARERAEAAFHAVAYHGAADFLGDGEADAHRGIRILPIADEQDEAGSGRAQAAVRGNEIGALLDRG